ncbi:MauE/DoxX family redox-associated membrane protein [Tundrisphaera lichenicola]|uniref:MauE/DoxX family redox-associated membrane protein n=1 Tax=Tundrisphaera lichenicola TaxID=2029860 RepID=UPI003EBFAC2B
MAASCIVLMSEVAGDQNRLQPWGYQYLVIGLGLVAFPQADAFRLARLYAISLYFYSGLSKFDVSFVDELGPTFLTAGLAPIGLNPGLWGNIARTSAILAMPAIEILIAVGLVFESTRRAALIGALGLHATLIGILGPWNLDHSTNVLIWNGALFCQDLVLFGNDRIAIPIEPGGRIRHHGLNLLHACVIIFPVGERFGLYDSWPSHALYASHCERTEVYLAEAALDQFSKAVLRHVAESTDGTWCKLDLTGWSREIRGTPLYPQGRVGSGLAEALATGQTGPLPVRVLQWSRANPWNGQRTLVECLGLRAIRRRGDRFWINAHPSPELPH